mmetsp:Transcript_10434/g.15072  ORF Transcript_10434/g.15072 Transcript_10434/m.15072 type:complete len:559 (+) Transcript_10434:390-2066(+)
MFSLFTEEDWMSETSASFKSTVTSQSHQETNSGIASCVTNQDMVDRSRAATPQEIECKIFSPQKTTTRSEIGKYTNSSKQLDDCDDKNLPPDTSRKCSEPCQRNKFILNTNASKEICNAWDIEALHEWNSGMAPVSKLTASPDQIHTLFKASLTPASLSKLQNAKGTPFQSTVTSTKKLLAFQTPLILPKQDNEEEGEAVAFCDRDEYSSCSLESDLRKEIEVQSRKIRSLKKKTSLLEKQYEAEQSLRNSSEASEAAAMESRDAAIAMLTEVMRAESNHTRAATPANAVGSKTYKDTGSDSCDPKSMQLSLEESNKCNYLVSIRSNFERTSTEPEREPSTSNENAHGDKFLNSPCSILKIDSQHNAKSVQQCQGNSLINNLTAEKRAGGMQDRALILQIRKDIEEIRVDFEKIRTLLINDIHEGNDFFRNCSERLMELIEDKSADRCELHPDASGTYCCRGSRSSKLSNEFNANTWKKSAVGAHASYASVSPRNKCCVSPYNPWEKANSTGLGLCEMWNKSLMILSKASRRVAAMTMMSLFVSFDGPKAKPTLHKQL